MGFTILIRISIGSRTRRGEIAALMEQRLLHWASHLCRVAVRVGASRREVAGSPRMKRCLDRSAGRWGRDSYDGATGIRGNVLARVLNATVRRAIALKGRTTAGHATRV